jgi:hypothetical protein
MNWRAMARVELRVRGRGKSVAAYLGELGAIGNRLEIEQSDLTCVVRRIIKPR